MLTELVVENLGVIDRAEVSFDAGATALTGETGAGKTLVVTALGLLAGGRADRVMVRAGADAARVEGMFTVDATHPVVTRLEDPAETADGRVEIVLSRTVSRDGRTRARVNGRIVTLNALASIGGHLIEIAGQNEHHRLGSPEEQRALLDRSAGPDVVALSSEVAAKVATLRAELARLDELTSGERERLREVDILRYEISEIEAVAPVPGETQELTGQAARLEHAEVLATGLQSAVSALKGEGGGGEALASARSTLESLVTHDRGLEPFVARLHDAEIEIADVAGELAGRVMAPDAHGLAETRARLDALGRLHRKFGPDDDAVLAHLARARERLEAITATSDDIEALTGEVEELKRDTVRAAERLSRARRTAAEDLERAVEEVLAELAMAGATFEVAIEQRDLYEGGIDSITFNIAADPGEAPKPLSKVASGGELSRISLALKLLGARSPSATTVFDEVDAGVGGQAAQAVGSKLARLAEDPGTQVLVVTHLPQVAAFADHQFRIRKNGAAGRSAASIQRVEAGERVEEITRMLAGLPDSERGRAHARELLEMAGRSAG